MDEKKAESSSPVLSLALCRTGHLWYLTVLREDGTASATMHETFHDALRAAVLLALAGFEA